MKRVISLLLTMIMIFGIMPISYGAESEAVAAADTLYALGLFSGTGTNPNGTPIYDLDRAPTRQEAITMLVGLLGKKEEALSGTWETPFTDVANWAKPFVGYAYVNGLTSGTSSTTFGGNDLVSAAQYLTFVLKVLGYEVGKDFQWNKAWELSDKIGMTHGEYDANTKTFLRGDVAVISANALEQTMVDTGEELGSFIRSQVIPAVDFSELLEEFSAKHKECVEAEGTFEGYEDDLIEDLSTATLLTDSEIASLLMDHSRPQTISYTQAVEDIDLLFRAFKSTYGAYYHFGEATFDAAQVEILKWLEGRNVVDTDDFNRVVANAFSFLRDAHAYVWEKTYESKLRYEYYYCSDQNFQKDIDGYYKMINGQKWYFSSFSDPRVRMEYTLTPSGEIVYAPILFCTALEMKNSTMVLKNGQDGIMTQTLNWKISRDRNVDNYDADFTLLKAEEIAYLSILNFQRRCEDDMVEFVNSGKVLDDAELIIFDLRSNGGGSGQYSKEWVENFCGTEPRVPQAYSERISLLGDMYHENTKSGTYGTFETQYQKGKFLKNDTPIIVLMDDRCGSAGESALHFLRSMENVLVVGSNSAGYQISSNSVNISLPNSGLPAQIGTTYRFEFSFENVDFKGFEPDVWCNPEIALDAVVNMLLRYDLADVSNWLSLKNELVK